MALVALVVPVTVFAVTATGAAANLLLVQSWFRAHDVVFSLNGVSWSLSCEAFFYLVAPFLIGWLAVRSRRTAVVVCLSWVALTATAALVLGLSSQQLDTVGYTNPAIRSGEFVLGVLLATLVRAGWRPRLRFSRRRGSPGRGRAGARPPAGDPADVRDRRPAHPVRRAS